MEWINKIKWSVYFSIWNWDKGEKNDSTTGDANKEYVVVWQTYSQIIHNYNRYRWIIYSL